MRNKSKLMVVMCIAMAIMAIGYAYFATNLDITSTGNITTNWNVNFISITEGSNGGTTGSNASTPTYTGTTATMSANLQVPGDYMEYDLVLKNSGNVNAIIEDINAVATGSPAIIFSISGLNEGDKLAGGDSKTIKIKIEYDSSVTSQPTETTKTLTVSIKAVQDTGQTITNQSPSINQPTYLSSAILKNNIAQADTNINFDNSSSDTNGKGLYYTNVNTENNGTTYYYRGDVENNYVKFGTATKGKCMYNGQEVAMWSDRGDMQFIIPEETCTTHEVCLIDDKPILKTEYYTCEELMYSAADIGYVEADSEVIETGKNATYNEVVEDLIWRIVRINEDGSIRLITKEIINHLEYNYVYYEAYSEEDDEIYKYSDNASIGYMYGEPGLTGDDAYKLTHANNNSSTAKKYIDEWYVKNLKTNYSSYIADAGFCNDRSIATSAGLWNSNDTALGYKGNQTYYGAFNRLVNLHKPQFGCPNDENDLFTTKNATKGNKALEYPIGLITADEIVFSGSPWLKSGNTYLQNNDTHHSMTWTMTPINYEDDFAYMAYYIDNYLDSIYSWFEFIAIRPVISLKSTVELSTELPDGCTKLDGTEACPYIIKTN